MEKFIGYVRTSTEEQLHSLAAQERKIRLYAELHNLDLIDIVVEQASAKDLKRKGLASVLSRLSECDGIIVAKLDRLSRSVKDMGELIERYFTKSKLVVIDENIDTRSAAGVLVLNVLISVSQWERQAIGERTSAALQHLIQDKGAHIGRAPFGFEKDGYGLKKNESEFKTIQLIKSLRNEGRTLQMICDQLHSLNIKSPLGKNWFPKTVSDIAKRDYQALLA
jgi:DNA invertase Pin-like site-specific DNA recombinase